jgi:zinc protease
VPFTGTGTEASLQKLTREDLAKWHDTWFKPNNATLLIVGDTTLKEITPQLEKIFAGWKPGDVPKKNVAPVQSASRAEVYLIDRPDSKQSTIFGALLAPPRNDPDAIPIQIVNNVFGGTFSARLNMNLREDKHWSYGTFAAMPPARGQRPYFSIAPVQTDKTKESLAEVVKEYRDITSGRPINEKELGREQGNATLGLPGSFESVQQLAGAYGQIIQYALPDDYFNTYTQKVLALNPASANAVAKKLIQPDHVVWVIVGDMSKVEQGIRELDLGEIHKIDADGNAVK